MYDKKTGLTVRQEAFCVGIVKSSDGNATQVYRDVFKPGKASQMTTSNNAYKLLQTPKIIARIAALRAHAVKKTELSIDMVLEEMCCIAFLDPLSAYDANGNMLPIKDMPEATRRAIRSIEVFQNGRVNIKFHDKVQALERLMRFLGMFEKDNKQQWYSPVNELTREQKKDLKECLTEIVRSYQEEDAAAAGGGDGGKTH